MGEPAAVLGAELDWAEGREGALEVGDVRSAAEVPRGEVDRGCVGYESELPERAQAELAPVQLAVEASLADLGNRVRAEDLQLKRPSWLP